MADKVVCSTKIMLLEVEIVTTEEVIEATIVEAEVVTKEVAVKCKRPLINSTNNSNNPSSKINLVLASLLYKCSRIFKDLSIPSNKLISKHNNR